MHPEGVPKADTFFFVKPQFSFSSYYTLKLASLDILWAIVSAVPNAEKYATHVENQLRSEHGLSLLERIIVRVLIQPGYLSLEQIKKFILQEDNNYWRRFSTNNTIYLLNIH